MQELFNLGITENDIKEMLETFPNIKDIDENNIKKLITILKRVGCSNRTIKDIIISNPFYLDRLDTDIIKLIQKLESIGLENLNILFDTNPYLLNKDAFEIDDFIKEHIQNYSLEEIAEAIDDNPYLLDE